MNIVPAKKCLDMFLLNEDTIAAPATVPGTGAITLIRVSGPEALHAVSAVVKCSPGRDIQSAPGYSVRFGQIFMHDGSLLDEVLVSVFRAPHSYTGEDSAEITCHASRYITDNILLLLAEKGIRAAAPGEFTRRAFLNGKMDLAQAEAVADLIAAENAAAHKVARNQLKGGFSVELRKMRDDLLNIVALMELELDFSEEDVEFADRTHLRELVDHVCSHIDGLISSFRYGNAIKNGIPVAIAGATNTGKSTLLNALTGEDRAIVSDVHGTTRDTVEETLNVGGLLFRFIDTAGIRKTDETVEKIGIERTFKKLSEAEIVLVMLDAGRWAGEDSCGDGALGELLDHIDTERQKIIFVLNKMDLLAGKDCANFSEELYLKMNGKGEFDIQDCDNKNVSNLNNLVKYINNKCVEINVKGASAVFVSAKRGDGMDTLKKALSDICADFIPASEGVVVTNMRHIEALSNARTSLSRVRSGLETSLPTDLVAQDIREVLYHLGSILGEISTDEVLGTIFSKFCIGK